MHREGHPYSMQHRLDATRQRLSACANPSAALTGRLGLGRAPAGMSTFTQFLGVTPGCMRLAAVRRDAIVVTSV